MQENDIKKLASSGIFNNKPVEGKIEETHISWVILSDKYVFKVKKPLKLSFLDFSTLPLRKHFCKKEVQLNSRFTDIYIDTVPIRKASGKLYINSGNGKIIEYAVLMKKMDVAKRMDNMLHQNKVNEESMHSLAKVTLSFHKHAQKIYSPFDISAAYDLFNDIDEASSFVEKQLGPGYADFIDDAIKWSNSFLKQHKNRFQQRIKSGFKRDLHGDLHSGNIFLYKKPVLFDCIEFNDQFRQIDMLYEIAFLCMDLESFHQKPLSEAFLSQYYRNSEGFEDKEDEDILTYFKCLRANVRAKVHTLSAMQIEDQKKIKDHADEIKKYLDLMREYTDKIN